MCGISGIINFNEKPVASQDLEKMMLSMKHRGPDDQGIFINNNTGLGFVRLSIIDLSPAGHQPMVSDNGRFVIVFNGEIFNYIELKQELEKEGVVFKTKTDTEVLLKAYIKWGSKCLDRLNGMWAFVIYDKETKTIFGSRDRYGIKPLYYYHDDERFIFSSEIKPILSILIEKPKPNSNAIFEYLTFNRTDHEDYTFFNGINKIKHGYNFEICNKQLHIQKWYDLKMNLKDPFANTVEYKEMLEDAVKIRLRSDVPVGVCFSGGLDSSGILGTILKEKSDINTFSSVYKKGDAGDETEYIELYKSKVTKMFFTTPKATSLFNDLDDLISTHAEPIPDTSPYAQYKVMELAHKNVVVTIDGQGADEQLAGYHYFFGLYFKELLINLQLLKFFKEILGYRKNHRSLFGIKTMIFFLIPSFLRTRLQAFKKGYLTSSFFKANYSSSSVSASLYNSKTLHDALLDHFEYKLEHLLKWEDKNSMRFGIEARVPFLDHRLVERTLSLPNDFLIKNGVTKIILRDAMKDEIPEQIRCRQDKVGFGTPEANWFREDYFKEFILDILSSTSLKARGIIDTEKAIVLYKKHVNKEIDISKEIWKWINLELWFRKFID